MLLVFGSHGYTGRLVVKEALARGVEPMLAGRREEAVRGHAEAARSGRALAWRAFTVDRPNLEGVTTVLNCAGPFVDTAEPLVRACIARGVNYIDVTGEIAVFEQLARMDAAAKLAGMTILPGAGFDVVPTDGMAAHLRGRIPDASKLELAICTSGGISHGTLTTALRGLGSAGCVRRGGVLVAEPVGARMRPIDFGDGKTRTAMSIPWGDVSTAWHTTGIPNTVTYMAVTPLVASAVTALGWTTPALAWGPLRALLQKQVDARAPGPSDEARARGWARVWGRVEAPDGRTATATLRTPEGYTLTARTAVDIAIRAERGELGHGFQTPASALGADYLLGFEGVTRTDVA